MEELSTELGAEEVNDSLCTQEELTIEPIVLEPINVSFDLSKDTTFLKNE